MLFSGEKNAKENWHQNIWLCACMRLKSLIVAEVIRSIFFYSETPEKHLNITKVQRLTESREDDGCCGKVKKCYIYPTICVL